MKAWAAALAILGGVAACAPNHGSAYPQRFAEAERAETAGRYEEASHRYDDAAVAAVRPRDRDHARYLAGVMLLRAGKLSDGVARLTPIAEADPPTIHSSDAAHRVAVSILIHGDEEDGYRALERLVTRFPDSGAAHPALRQVLTHKDAGPGGSGASLAYLRGLEATLGTTDLGELLHYEIAERLSAQGDLPGARDTYLETAKRWPYPHGALWDDALLHASEIDEKLGRYEDAVADLDRMLGERETTYLVGSYQRPKMGRALFRKALLYANHLGDRPKARALFHSLYTDYTSSRLRDDALWYEAALWKADGDAKTACDRLAVLTQDFPDSRYVPCAVEEGAASCAGRIARPPKSGAPKSCHPYLARMDRLPTD
jgi:tetratricopeptide (TPR) repeat protein